MPSWYSNQIRKWRNSSSLRELISSLGSSKNGMKEITNDSWFYQWKSTFYLFKIINMATIFSRIIDREIPSFKIYEDEYVYAFLDIFPQQRGHTLIVPKIEIDHFSDVPEPYYTAIFQAAKKLSRAIQVATGCTRVCTVFAWYDVPHCHYHLIPTSSMHDIQFSSHPQADMDELKKIQELIVAALSGIQH